MTQNQSPKPQHHHHSLQIKTPTKPSNPKRQTPQRYCRSQPPLTPTLPLISIHFFFRVFESKKKKGGEERESKQRKRIKERERKREIEKRYLKYKIFIFYNFVATVSYYVWQFTVT